MMASFGRRRPRDRRGGLWDLAGWVFADSLLALAVVFLATQRLVVAPASVQCPPLPAPPPLLRVAAVDDRYVCFRVFTDPAAGDVVAQVRAKLAQPSLAGKRAGIVLTLGVAPESLRGVDEARRFNDAVLPQFPQTFQQVDGSLVTSRPFWGGKPGRHGHPDGSIEVNIYPIVDETHGPLRPQDQTEC